MEPLTRRQVVTAGVAACACALCPLVSCAPNTAPADDGTGDGVAPGAAGTSGPVDVGAVGSFNRDGAYDRWAGVVGFFVVRAGSRLYAPSSTCTHKKVKLVASGAEGFKCPRHGSIFTPRGDVTKGPARRALPRFAVRVDEQGHVWVDPSRRFGQGQWDDPDSYVALPV